MLQLVIEPRPLHIPVQQQQQTRRQVLAPLRVSRQHRLQRLTHMARLGAREPLFIGALAGGQVGVEQNLAEFRADVRAGRSPRSSQEEQT